MVKAKVLTVPNGPRLPVSPPLAIALLLGLTVAVTLLLPLLSNALDIQLISSVLPAPQGLLPTLLPVVVLVGVALLVNLARRRQGHDRVGNGSHNGLPPPSKMASGNHRTIVADPPATRFSDVAGVEEAKEDLQEVVQFLRAPAKFATLGARIPRGVLLVGPPGTGKTLLARAVAGEAGVPFIAVSGSEFVELYVGVGASRVRALFQDARKLAPCIVFVDEIDAVGRKRSGSAGVSHEEREQTLNQILVEMDGFDSHTNVMVLAATNRADVLDDALLRPGRFDRQVHLDLPDAVGRLSILQVHTRGKPLDRSIDLAEIARLTTGLSGADLENLANEAAILTARRDLPVIGREELEEALDRVTAGPRRKSRLLSEREKEITAHHEIGHALVAWAQRSADRVHKVTIVSRGMTGGHTRLVPGEDRNMWSKSEFDAMIATALGGHVVEEMLFGEVTTGPSNDLQRASEIARRMVTEFGMSKALGPLAYLARSMWSESPDYRAFGEQTARRIAQEVNLVVRDAHQRARHIVEENREVLIAAAHQLMDKETLDWDDLQAAFADVVMFQPASPSKTAHDRKAEPRRQSVGVWRRRRREALAPQAIMASQRYRR